MHGNVQSFWIEGRSFGPFVSRDIWFDSPLELMLLSDDTVYLAWRIARYVDFLRGINKQEI